MKSPMKRDTWSLDCKRFLQERKMGDILGHEHGIMQCHKKCYREKRYVKQRSPNAQAPAHLELGYANMCSSTCVSVSYACRSICARGRHTHMCTCCSHACLPLTQNHPFSPPNQSAKLKRLGTAEVKWMEGEVPWNISTDICKLQIHL